MAKKKKKNPTPSMGIGQTYVNAKLGNAIVSPYVEIALRPGGTRLSTVEEQTKNIVFVPGFRNEYLKGVGVAIIDRWGEKKIDHAAALSRRSISAWLGEAPAILNGAAQNDLHGGYRAVTRSTNGFDPGTFQHSTGDLRTYLITKYGLAIGRKVVNRTAILDPAKKFLGQLGVTV